MIWRGPLLAYAHCTPSLVHIRRWAHHHVFFPFSLCSVDYVDKQLTVIQLRCIIYTYALF